MVILMSGYSWLNAGSIFFHDVRIRHFLHDHRELPRDRAGSRGYPSWSSFLRAPAPGSDHRDDGEQRKPRAELPHHIYCSDTHGGLPLPFTDQSMCAPPLTARASPVMKEASGPAKKATARATSSGVSILPSGVSLT